MIGGAGEYEEHHFRRVIPGDIETVRRKLCDVLEDFNFIVLSENPLQARRPAQKNIITATVIEYDTRLTVALKTISPASTLATFDYAVPYLFGKGDRVALECEADAIIALATNVLNDTLCSCGAENAGKVRFCRVCGTPVAHKLPAELEVRRLTAELSGAYIEVGWGVVIVLLTLLNTLPMILFGNPKVVNVGWVLFVIGQNLGWFMLLSALFRLRRTIAATGTAQQNQQPEIPHTSASQERAALPPTPASITEGTTELINQPQPVSLSAARGKDTDEMQ